MWCFGDISCKHILFFDRKMFTFTFCLSPFVAEYSAILAGDAGHGVVASQSWSRSIGASAAKPHEEYVQSHAGAFECIGHPSGSRSSSHHRQIERGTQTFESVQIVSARNGNSKFILDLFNYFRLTTKRPKYLIRSPKSRNGMHRMRNNFPNCITSPSNWVAATCCWIRIWRAWKRWTICWTSANDCHRSFGKHPKLQNNVDFACE